jgi:serine/threonine protein kinase
VPFSPDEISKMLSDVPSEALPEALPEKSEDSYRVRGKARAPSDDEVSPGDLSRTRIILPTWHVETTGAGETTKQSPDTRFSAYALRRLIGEGGFGEVWEATQASLGRIVAVKKMRPELHKEAVGHFEDEKALEDDFRREALTTALLEHPNIVPVHDLGVDENGRPLLAMKLVRGQRWDEILWYDRQSMTPEEYHARHIPILVSISQAVAFAHSRGIIHRDLKPSQVMVGDYGEVMLMDWGIAVVYDMRLLSNAIQEVPIGVAPTLAEAINPTGTPAYMAPEQTRASTSGLGPWTDVFLLGGMLYYILTAQSPYSGENAVESFRRAIVGDLIRPDVVCPERPLPQELVRICLKALELEPANRFLSAIDFIDALEAYRTGASNRSESLKLVRSVERELESSHGNYAVLNTCQTHMIRALSLWPENPQANAVMQRIREEFAAAALENKDLVLAALMAEEIENTQVKIQLLDQIHEVQKKVRFSNRQRKLLLVVTAILFVAVIVDVILLYNWARAEDSSALMNRVERAEMRARAAEQALRVHQPDYIAPEFELPDEDVEPADEP